MPKTSKPSPEMAAMEKAIRSEVLKRKGPSFDPVALYQDIYFAGMEAAEKEVYNRRDYLVPADAVAALRSRLRRELKGRG